jgi:MFS transporter, PAT family, solute carrier family 33 (acetyl-CoA transportor), member 1
VLLEFPCELFSAVLAGRWAAGATPFGPWMRGYWLRLLTAAAATTLVSAAAAAADKR